MSTKTSQRGHVAGGTSGLTTVDAVRGPRATTLLKRCRKIAAVLARRATKAGRQTTAARLHHQSIDRSGAFAVQVRLALEELGPTFVKLGQLLSARSDITPPALQHELSKLRDHAPSIPQATVLARLQRDAGPSETGSFAAFEIAPVACASIAQVHRATLHDGRRVAVKIRRPEVCSDIETDLALLRQFARLVARLSPSARAYDPVGLLEQFAAVLRAETDFTTEAANIEVIRHSLADSDVVTIPDVITNMSDDSLLVMDWIDGIPLTNDEELDAAGTDRGAVARAIVHAYAAMIFQSDLFHADPHPGNLIALTGGRLGLIDFGEVGSVAPATRSALMSMLTAVLARDSASLGDAVLSVSRMTRSVDRAGFDAELATLLRPVLDSSLRDVKLGTILRELLHILRRRGLVLPNELAVLVKTMAVCEATTDELDPTLTMLGFLSELGTVARAPEPAGQ